MKTKKFCQRFTGLSFGFIFVFLAAVIQPSSLFAQAPGLMWTTNVGATLFAVDAQINAYASMTGAVIKINDLGQPLATNILNVRATHMQRDSDGNFYVAGITPSEYIVHPYNFTNPACFVAKYTEGGSLVWSNNFGPTGGVSDGPAVYITDLRVVGDGTVYAGFWYRLSSTYAVSRMAKLDTAGSNVWTIDVPRGSGGSAYPIPASVRFGPLTPATGIGYVIGYGGQGPAGAMLTQIDINAGVGTAGLGSWWTENGFTQPQRQFTRPSTTSQGDWFNVEGGNLVKRSFNGSLISTSSVIDSASWIVSADPWDGVYVGMITNSLMRFDSDGKPAWTLGLSAMCKSMIVDGQGNRFISTTDGAVSRLVPENISGPVITNTLADKILFAGSNHVFTIGATGSGPLRYYWLLNGVPLPGRTNATLSLTNLVPSQTGNYSVIVSNFIGSVTSAPALLTVKGVGIFLGTQMLTNGTYNFITPPTLSVLSAFTNGSSFYTLDGSPPTFASTPYTTPFAVQSSALVRALGYSADFSQSEEALPPNIVLLPTYTLSASSTVGGYVTLNPSGGTYASNTVVTATATATNGWSFLYWLGDASGANPSANITMTANKSIQAVFGTTLSTTTTGGGNVYLYPAGGIYPAGSTIRLTAVPNPGNYFGVWGNAASGNTNPLYFVINAPAQTVSSLFAATPAGQSALTVIIVGKGTVNVNPRANAYATNSTVTLAATPDAGQAFLRWTGATNSPSNTVTLSMDQPRTIIANFTGPFSLRADSQTPQGFLFSILGDPFAEYQVFSSTNLTQWTLLGNYSNSAAQTQFNDSSATNSPTKFYRATQ